MASERCGGGGLPRLLRSSSTCSSLAFIDVAFANTPISPDGPDSSCELQVVSGSGAPEGPYPSSSCSSVGPPHQNVEGSDGRTRRPSLVSRFFLREFFHGEAQTEQPGDAETRRESTCSTDCIDVMLSCGPCGDAVDSFREHEEPPRNVAVFATDPAEKVRYSRVMTWRMLWATATILLLFGTAIATISQLTISYIFSDVREAALKAETVGVQVVPVYPGTAQRPMRATEWLPTQIASDVLYVILVLTSILRWYCLQSRMRAAVLLRFAACLILGLVLKLTLSATFGFAYRPLGTQVHGASYVDTVVLAIRFVFGLTLPEDADGVPGYGRMITSQLFVFWFLYTWRCPVLLVLPTALTFTIFVLGSVDGLRSVFDALLALFIVAVGSAFYHLLLDSAARDLFMTLRADIVSSETQPNQPHVQQRLSGVYTAVPMVSRLSINNPNFYGYVPHGGFISQKLWDSLSRWTGRLESLEERVRYTLRSYGLYVAQQHNVHFVLPPPTQQTPEEIGGLPVASRATPTSETNILSDDRMIWATICECYSPRPPAFCGQQQMQKIACCTPKWGMRNEERTEAAPGVATHAL